MSGNDKMSGDDIMSEGDIMLVAVNTFPTDVLTTDIKRLCLPSGTRESILYKSKCESFILEGGEKNT